MRKLCLLLIPIILLVPTAARAQRDDRIDDETAIRRVVSDYAAAWRNSSVEAMRKVLHPQAKLFLPATGKTELVVQTPSQLYANFKSNHQHGDDMVPRRDATLRVERVDHNSDVASVTIKVTTRGFDVTEHLSLMKFADGWKIVCRVMSVLD